MVTIRPTTTDIELLLFYSPLPIKCRISAWASIICPALSMQPQPQSEVRVEPGSGGKSSLYVSQTRDTKSFRKASTFPLMKSSSDASQQASVGLLLSEANKWDQIRFWSLHKYKSDRSVVSQLDELSIFILFNRLPLHSLLRKHFPT